MTLSFHFWLQRPNTDVRKEFFTTFVQKELHTRVPTSDRENKFKGQRTLSVCEQQHILHKYETLFDRDIETQ